MAHKSYIIIENPKPSNNLGPILRCAAAYAVSEVVFVGHERCSTDGSHGSARHLKTTAFPTFAQASAHLREECMVNQILGLLGGASGENVYDDSGCEVSERKYQCKFRGESRIATVTRRGRHDRVNKDNVDATSFPRSTPVNKRPFRGATAFLVSKNWRGLPVEQAKICDSFVHVPQSPIMFVCRTQTEDGTDERVKEKMESTLQESNAMFLDTPASLSIVLHHFTAWARYDERVFVGQKFDVAKYRKGEVSEEEKELKAALRLKRREEADLAWEEGKLEAEAAGMNVFGTFGNGCEDY